MNGHSELNEVSLHARDYGRVLYNRWALVLCSVLLVFLTALAITYITPRKYNGKVVMEISRPVGRGEAGVEIAIQSQRYIENQFQVISSKEVLGRVVEKLGLIERWDSGTSLEAYRQLNSMVETSEERGTDMVNIEVLSDDSVEAAELANAVAAAYEERRSELFSARLAEVEKSLADQELAQEAKLAKAHERFIDEAERLGIANIDPAFFSRFQTADETGGLQALLERMQGEVFAAETELHQAESKVKGVEGLEGDQLIRMAVPMGLSDPTLSTRYEQYKSMQLELIDLRRAGVGEGHPRVVGISEKLVAIRGFLLDSARELKAGLVQNLELARLSHLRLEEAYAALKEKSHGARKSNQGFIAAMRDYQVQLSTLSTLKLTLEQQRVDMSVDPSAVTMHERAEPDDRAASPNVQLNLILGGVIGLLFGVGMAFGLEYMDTSVKSVDEVEERLGAPVLAVVPKEVALLHESGASHADAEAYRILRTNIEFARGADTGNVITFVSGGAGEGKSTTLMNFATVCANGGLNVLMIDGDLRRPRLHEMFKIRNSVGLTNYLSTDLALEDVVLRTPIDSLFFIPSGILPADGNGILGSRRFKELLADARSRFDLVLVDSPPILGVSDGSVLAAEADMTVVVVQHGKLPRQMLAKVRGAADKVGANLLGAVLNNVDLRSDSQYQYYTSYYTYYSAESGAGAVAARGSKAAEAAGRQMADADF